MSEMLSRSERHFRFSTKEMHMLLATAFVAAFGLTLSNGWGVFNFFEDEGIHNYIMNLLFTLIFVFCALILHFAVQKMVALRLGYVSEYKYWMNGFVISTFLCFVTFSFLPLFFTGSLWSKVEKKIRMGRFRYGPMHSDLGLIAFSGPFASILLALFLGFFYVASESSMLFAFIVANLLVAIYSMIPIPQFEKFRQFQGGTTGLYLFIASRWVFVLTMSLVLFFSLMIFIAKIFSLVVALILAIFVTVIYYNSYEKL